MSNYLITAFGIILIFAATTLGSAFVFFFKREIGERLNASIMGFASGIMFAACFCELIMPAIDNSLNWWSVIGGLIIGNIFMLVLDKTIKKPTINHSNFMFAITIHNIPEGLIVGLSFGSALIAANSILPALFLAASIALQNVPEGMAVSFALKNRQGNKKAFINGMLSGIVEPIFAIFGLILSASLSSLISWFLAFAAGVMMYVSVDEMIPESKHISKIGTVFFAIGFIILLAFELIV